MEKKLYADFCENIEAFYADLKPLMHIKSDSENRPEVTKALHYVIKKAKDYGLETRVVLNDEVGIVEYGQGDEVLGILVHVDVVQALQEEWNYPAYDLTLEEGMLYGRGIVDDKGPCMMMINILKSMKERGIKTNRKIQVIIGTREEIEWTDMAAYVEAFELPTFGFTPDGEFPVQNAEKGYADVMLTFNKGSIQSISAGTSTNSVPSNFSVTVDGNTYAYTGKTAHSSTPDQGQNAIALGVNELVTKHTHPFFQVMETYFSDYYGKAFGLDFEDYVNDTCLNKTTLVPSMIVDHGKTFTLTINLRLAHKNTLDKFSAIIHEIKDKYDFSYEVGEYLPSIYVDKNLEFVQILKKTYDENMHTETEFDLAFGTSYAKAMPNFVSFGPIFPGTEDTAHEANERIREENFMKAQKIYIEAICRLCL